MKHIINSKKGVSPLIATVLLIAIVITIALVILGWLSTLTKTTTSTVTNKTSESVNCASASISIEDVFVIGTGSTASANVIVKNTGFTNGLNISGTLLNSSGYNFSATQQTSLLNKGNVFTLNFPSISVATCPNSFSRVIVTTDCGGVLESFTGTPKCA